MYKGLGSDQGQDYALIKTHPDTTLIVTEVNKTTIEINNREYKVEKDGTFGTGYSTLGGYRYYHGGSFRGDSLYYSVGSNLSSYFFRGIKN